MFSHLFVAEEKTVPNPVADIVEAIVSEVVADAKTKEVVADVKEVVADVKEVVADAKEVVADVKEVVADAKEVVADAKEVAQDIEKLVVENANKCGVFCVIM